MKLLIQKTNKTKGNIKKIELTSSDFENNTNTYVIKENESPIIYLTDTQSSYFIDDIDSKLERINSETVAIITMDDLISLGGGTGGDSRPYKVYTALLTQTGTNAPVATVLENTLGYDIVWSRLNAGAYLAKATEFAIEDVNKFYCNIGNRLPSGASTDIASYIVEASNLPAGFPSSFEVYTKTILNSTGVVTRGDNILEFTPIEIRVYN